MPSVPLAAGLRETELECDKVRGTQRKRSNEMYKTKTRTKWEERGQKNHRERNRFKESMMILNLFPPVATVCFILEGHITVQMSHDVKIRVNVGVCQE